MTILIIDENGDLTQTKEPISKDNITMAQKQLLRLVKTRTTIQETVCFEEFDPETEEWVDIPENQ